MFLRLDTARQALKRKIDFASAFNPILQFGTGLGLAGKKVLVDSSLLELASEVELRIGDEKFECEIDREFPNGLTLLSYQGPDFPQLVVDEFNELSFNFPVVYWISPGGEIEFRMVKPSQLGGGAEGQAQFDNSTLPRECLGGVVLHYWGAISGMVTKDNHGYSIVPMSSIHTKTQYDEETFDFATSETALTMEESKAIVEPQSGSSCRSAPVGARFSGPNSILCRHQFQTQRQRTARCRTRTSIF